MNHYYELAKHELYKSAILNIQIAITLQFFQNLEHRDNYLYSKVEYEGETCPVVFYDWKQYDSVIYKLASYFVQ